MNLDKSKLNRVLLISLFIGVFVFFLLNNNFSPRPNVLNSNQDGVGEFKIAKYIDGDTIEVNINNKPTLVRFLGINTPEKENPYRHQQCFGPEASQETRKLLAGGVVYLLPDPGAPNRGRYGRLLRYIFLPDGTFVNAFLVKNGYAFSYIYKNQKLQFNGFFKELESEAKEEKLGLWGKCNY